MPGNNQVALDPLAVEAFLGTPAERMLFCGVAIGWGDASEPVNRRRSLRADEEEWLTVLG